jgi:hypothetical protein
MLKSILELLPIIGPITARAPQFIALVEQISATLNEDDQATLKSELEKAQAASDEAHKELQEKPS